MTEAEWLAATDPEKMVRDVLVQLPDNRPAHEWHLRSSRQLDLFCVACYRRLVHHLHPEERSEKAMEWMEANAGLKPISHAIDCEMEEHGQNIKDYSEDVENEGVQGIVARLTEELWCGDLHMPLHWFCHAFETEYPGFLIPNTAAYLADVIRDIFGNPFRPTTVERDWLTSTVVALARQMYEARDFAAMPILADALQDAGCDNEDILTHCRGDGPHVRGCWVVDLILGKT